MPLIIRNDHDSGVVQLSLSSGGGNPLTPALLEALRAEIMKLAEAPPRALVLDGGSGKLFSGGFDVPTIATYGREELRAFFTGFLEIVQGILRLEAPSICAVHGPAIAGGFILSLACDLRVVGPGARKLGLSEVDLAIAVPAGTQVLLAARTNLQTSLNLAMSAHTIGPEEARAVGYADELADNPVARALEIARSLAEKPGRGAAVTRLFPGLALADRALEADRAHLERFLDTWMSPEAQRRLQALAAHLTRK